jgi:hypothetical protein
MNKLAFLPSISPFLHDHFFFYPITTIIINNSMRIRLMESFLGWLWNVWWILRWESKVLWREAKILLWWESGCEWFLGKIGSSEVGECARKSSRQCSG